MTIEEVKALILEWKQAREHLDALCSLTAPMPDDEVVVRLNRLEKRLLEFAQS